MSRLLRGFISAVCVLISFSLHAEERSVQERINDAFALLSSSGYSQEGAKAAADALSAITEPQGRAALAILLHYEMQDTESKNQVGIIVDGLVSESVNRAHETGNPVAEAILAYIRKMIEYNGYDGSALSLINGLLIAHHNLSHTVTYGSHPSPENFRVAFEIPCDFFLHHPSIGAATRVISSDRYKFVAFNIECEERLLEEMPNTQKFWEMGKEITTNTQKMSNCGSIYRDRAAGLKFARYMAFYRPQDIVTRNNYWNPNNRTDLRSSNLFDWALADPKNYEFFEKLESLYKSARLEFTTYYNRISDLSEQDIQYATAQALVGLLLDVHFKKESSRSLPTDFSGEREIRYSILNGNEITVAMLPQAEDIKLPPEFPDQILQFSWYNLPLSGWPEPLLHIAVNRPEVVRLMLERGYDIEMRDALGKTPLMMSALSDNLDTLELLLSRGAHIDAQSYVPEKIIANQALYDGDICKAVYNVHVGKRTALMYAIAEASESLIDALIKAGADLNAVDSGGHSLLNYLEGTGPTPVNPKLSEKYKNDLKQRLTRNQSP